MALTTGDILRIVATMAWTDGNIMQNIFAAVLSGAGGPWDEADILADAGAWLDNMYDNLTTNIAETLDGSQVEVYVWDPVDSDFDEVGTATWTWDPSQVSHELPRGISYLATGYSTNPDSIAKKYIGGWTEGGISVGLFNAGITVQMALFILDWITAFVGAASGATFTPGVWSPTDNAHYVFSGGTLASPIPAYQRRRKRGVGI